MDTNDIEDSKGMLTSKELPLPVPLARTNLESIMNRITGYKEGLHIDQGGDRYKTQFCGHRRP